MTKLTYEEWRKLHPVQVTEAARDEIENLHAINVDAEIELAMRNEYDFYLNGGYDSE